MSSAAKLRNRGIAIAGATAIVMTSFGPAAFAFTDPSVNPTTSNQAGAASIGLVDADTAKEGTQGAQIVTPGGNGQEIGEVRFVIPATFEAGDTYTFTVQPAAGGITDATKRVSFSSTPSIAFDPQPYDADTHVADYSSTYASGAGKTSSEAAGSTEGGALTKYVANGSTKTTAAAPQFDVSLSSAGANNFNNRVTITFKNNSDPASGTAKFIGSLRAKVDVGTAVTGDIGITGASGDAAGGGTSAPQFLSDTGSTVRATTYPATVSGASLDVANGNVTADGTQQYVGPLTVQAANGSLLSDGTSKTVTTTLANADYVTTVKATATAYDSTGKNIGTDTITPGTNSLSWTNVPANATKVVFSGMAVQAPSSAKRLVYSLTSAGPAVLPSATLGGSSAHQLDITAPAAVTVSQSTATETPSRLGGQDRYQTAVKIAEQDLGTDENGPRGESDNVVIASGEGFADALSSGYLAATKNAKLILTRQGSLPQTDVEFLKTYGAKNIFIVGGYGSVSKAVEDQLRGMQSYDVQAKSQTQQVQRTVHTGTVALASTGGVGSATLTPGTPGALSYTRQADAPVDLVVTVDRAVTTGAIDTGGITSTTPGYTVTWTSGNTASVTFTRANGSKGSATLTVPVTGNTAGDDTYTFAVTDRTENVTSTEPVDGGPTDATATGTDRMVVPLDAKLTVTRLAGSDRFETNKKVNMYAAETATNPVGVTVPEYGKPSRKTATVTNGMAPWDALAAGPLVGNAYNQFPIPVVLTRGDASMTQAAADQIGQMDIKHLLFVGGKGVLPDELMAEGAKRNISATRLGGDSRWATAKAVSEFALKDADVSATNTTPGLGFASSTNIKRPFLANGGSMDGNTGSAIARGAWADALAAGPAAANQRTIIALTDSEKLPDETKALLTTNRGALDTVVALGLGGVVSTAVVNAANDAVTK